MEKNKPEIRTWFKKDEDSLKKMENDLVATLGRPTSFNFMMKIETSQNRTLKVQKRMKIGVNNRKRIVVAEWVDEEAKMHLKE